MPATLRCLWIAAAVVLAGCGSQRELGEVEGIVRAGGQPLAGVLITFVPETAPGNAAPRSLSQTDAKGRYVLRTESQREGAVVGKHRVVVEDLAILLAPRSPDGTVVKRPPVRVSARYTDPLRTPLLVEVKPGSQAINLDLVSSP